MFRVRVQCLNVFVATMVFCGSSVLASVCGDWGYLEGDYDRDCHVEMKDLSILAAQWLEGTDITDLERLSTSWLGCTDPTGAGCINRVITVPGDYDTIQEAVDVATSGMVVEVSDGTYTCPPGANSVVKFRGEDIILRSVNGPEVTILDAQGDPESRTVIVFEGTETSNCVLDGFTITGGYKSVVDIGGLFYTAGISGIDDISDIGDPNSTVSQATIKNCNITGNNEGHVFYPFYGDILNCHIYDNVSSGLAQKTVLVDCDGRIAYNLIENNTTGYYQGLIVISDGLIENNIIKNNSVGAGIIHYNNALFRNNTIVNNNNVEKTITGTGGTYINNIDWNNSTPGAVGGLNVTYSVSNVSIPGIGNITSDPNFVDPNDFHLNDVSPCIDSGSPLVAKAPADDFDGKLRDTSPDIGAYEGALRPNAVNLNTGLGYNTIQEAVTNAGIGDVIQVKPGTYNESVTFNKNITLTSKEGRDFTTISASGSSTLTFSGSETAACVISGFTLTGDAGVISGNNTLAKISDCVITNAIGSVDIVQSFDGDILNCHIHNNQVAGNALISLCDGRIAYNLIENNTTTSQGLITSCGGTVENNIIKGNSIGGGILQDNSGTIRNNTIAENTNSDTTFAGAGGIYVNNIDWNNAIPGAALGLNVTYTDSNAAIPGTGNIVADPLFATGSFTLTLGSPCIDSGNPANASADDYNGIARDAAPDMGAYEFAGVKAVYNVTKSSYFDTIQAAIDDAAVDDIIEVADGTYNENVSILKDLTLRSQNGMASTSILSPGTVLTFGASTTSSCLVEGFTLTGGAGCISGNGSGATVQDCNMTGNEGGNIVVSFNGLIQRNNISDNICPSNCSVFVNSMCDVVGNVIKNNLVADGTVVLFISHYGTIENNLIVGNLSYSVFYSCGGTIRNNTIADNPILAAFCLGGNSTFVNNIVWGNTNGIFSIWAGLQTVPTYCDIQSYVGGGVGNITSDPLFVDAFGGDYSLTSSSPCIDSGDPTNAPLNDINGTARDANPDMGAYEY